MELRNKIEKEYLYNINLNDKFFDSLRELYKDFDKWFINKQKNNEQAYIVKNDKNELVAFLLFKEEGENEDYSAFDKPFEKKRRLKICTLKVSIKGANISKSFFEIVMREAIEKGINEIYVTVFEELKEVIYILKKEGFKFYTYKNTMTLENKVKKEAVYVKSTTGDT